MTPNSEKKSRPKQSRNPRSRRDDAAVPIGVGDLLGESAEHDPNSAGLYTRVYECVQRIPRGKVSTYGTIAALLKRCGPRQVGYALAALPNAADVPWHRVINAQGRLSTRAGGGGTEVQRIRLQAEGIVFDAKGRIDLHHYGWPDPSSDPVKDPAVKAVPSSVLKAD